MARLPLDVPAVRGMDATHTGAYQQRYRELLIRMFNEFKARLYPLINQHLSVSKPGGMAELRKTMDSIINRAQIEQDYGAGVTRDITASYTLGRRMAMENPRIKRDGSILIPYQLSTRDQMVVSDLIERNLGQLTRSTDEMKTSILQMLIDGIKEQRSTQDIIRDIRTSIDGMTKTKAETIARTEIAYSYNNATAEAYKQAGVDQWQWIAALGYYCCDVCQEKHGQIYDWGDPQPPEHPNCLCTLYPVINREAA